MAADLFADENKDASRSCHDIDQKYGRPHRQAEPQEPVEYQENREQNHADVLVFHAADIADRLLP